MSLKPDSEKFLLVNVIHVSFSSQSHMAPQMQAGIRGPPPMVPGMPPRGGPPGPPPGMMMRPGGPGFPPR